MGTRGKKVQVNNTGTVRHIGRTECDNMYTIDIIGTKNPKITS